MYIKPNYNDKIEELKGMDLGSIYTDTQLFEKFERILLDIINSHESACSGMVNMYRRYFGIVPILTREVHEAVDSINNKIANDFLGEAVDISTGYFSGSPISYTYNQELPEYETAHKLIQRYMKFANISDVDNENTKLASICGYSGRLVYFKEGEPTCTWLYPWETIILGDDEPSFGIRLYPKNDNNQFYIEFYDQYYRYDFILNRGRIELNATAPLEHMFTYVPIFMFKRNEEYIGDCDKAITIMDAYDTTLSDASSEITAFRFAYLLIKGDIDRDDIEQAKQIGTFVLPTAKDLDVGIEFLTKNINDKLIEDHLDRLHDNIYKFTKTPNLSDEQFSGNISGIALKFKLFGLENKTKVFQNKFDKASRYMFKVLASFWKIKTTIPSEAETDVTSLKPTKIDPTEVVIEYKRTFPMDVLYEANATAILKGQVSEQTRLGLLSFVEDAEYEIVQLEKDEQKRMDMAMSQMEQQAKIAGENDANSLGGSGNGNNQTDNGKSQQNP